MNRLQKMLAGMILGKDTTRALSLTEPKFWRDETFTESAPSDPDGSSALSLSAVWACVNLLAGTIGSLPVMVYRTRADGQRELAKDHPLYRLLHDSPNALQTAVDFWEFIEASVELWGNGYARKVKSGGRTVSLITIMPQLPTVRKLGSGRLGYRWTEDGKEFDLTSDDVLHIRGFGGNPLGGMSTLAFARRTFGVGLDLDRAARSTFQNGLRPSGVLTFEKFLTAEQRAIIEKAIGEKMLGAMNTGRPFLLEGGTKWEQLSVNPEDAQMLESRGFSVEEIARFFGVPPFMIGHTEKSTSWGTGLEQQTLGFVKFALRRRLKRIEQALEKQMLTAEDRAEGVVIEFSLEGLLRGDSAGRASFYQSGLTNGWLTINEVRQLENLPPVFGGDVPRMQSQNVPITQAPNPEALSAPQEDPA